MHPDAVIRLYKCIVSVWLYCAVCRACCCCCCCLSVCHRQPRHNMVCWGNGRDSGVLGESDSFGPSRGDGRPSVSVEQPQCSAAPQLAHPCRKREEQKFLLELRPGQDQALQCPSRAPLATAACLDGRIAAKPFALPSVVRVIRPAMLTQTHTSRFVALGFVSPAVIRQLARVGSLPPRRAQCDGRVYMYVQVYCTVRGRGNAPLLGR